MDLDLSKYFQTENKAFYYNDNGEKRPRGVKWYGDTVRKDKAKDQSDLPPTPICNVFIYVNLSLIHI